MSRKELHKLLDMVLDIGSSSKHRVNLSVSTDNELGMYADIFIHKTDKNGFSIGVTEHISISDMTNTSEVRARLTAWKEILDKERENDEANKS